MNHNNHHNVEKDPARQLIDLAFSFGSVRALQIGNQLDIFTELAKSPLSATYNVDERFEHLIERLRNRGNRKKITLVIDHA